MAHKKFGRSKTEALKEAISFELAGINFMCRPSVAVASVIRLVDHGDAEGTNTLRALLQFLKDALMPGEYAKLDALLEDPDAELNLEDLAEAVGWLAEQYTGGRPTGGQSSATSSNPSTGDASTGGSSQGTPTYSRSQPTAL